MAINRAAFNFADMRFTGQLQKNVPTIDGAGGQADNFVTILTTRVYLEKVSGQDGFPEGRMEYVKQYILKCRAQKALGELVNGIWISYITADSIWLINGEQYDIDDWERVDMVPHFYVMRLTKNQ